MQETSLMAEWTVDVPDDLDARLKSHLAEHGGDLAEFVSQAVDERLTLENDDLQAEITAKVEQGLAEIEAGRGVDAREAMRQIAEEFGLRRRQ
jgi:predicted transcriptional regulator